MRCTRISNPRDAGISRSKAPLRMSGDGAAMKWVAASGGGRRKRSVPEGDVCRRGRRGGLNSAHETHENRAEGQCLSMQDQTRDRRLVDF